MRELSNPKPPDSEFPQQMLRTKLSYSMGFLSCYNAVMETTETPVPKIRKWIPPRRICWTVFGISLVIAIIGFILQQAPG